MKARISISLALIELLFTQMSVACNAPTGIDVPDGKSASNDEMTKTAENFRQTVANYEARR